MSLVHDFIDRRDEQMLFREVLGSDGPCVIPVCAKTGNGKSRLLEMLEGLTVAHDKEAAAVRVEIKQSTEPLSLAEQLREQLKIFGEDLGRFEKRDIARTGHRHEEFGFSKPVVPERVDVRFADVDVSGGALTGASLGSLWTQDQDRRAREACLDALLDDLHEISQRRTVVILLDRYPQATDHGVNSWLEGALSRVLQRSDFGRLIVVAASEVLPFPKLQAAMGAKAPNRIRPIELGIWGEDDITLWLEHLGVDNPSAWGPAVRDMFEKGQSLKDVRLGLHLIGAMTP